MAAGLNDAGRGLNIAVVNPRTKDVIRVGHFDTFGSGFYQTADCGCVIDLLYLSTADCTLYQPLFKIGTCYSMFDLTVCCQLRQPSDCLYC